MMRAGAGMPEETEDKSGIAYYTRNLDDQAFKYGNHPRETVSWLSAVAFCRWLDEQIGL